MHNQTSTPFANMQVHIMSLMTIYVYDVQHVTKFLASLCVDQSENEVVCMSSGGKKYCIPCLFHAGNISAIYALVLLQCLLSPNKRKGMYDTAVIFAPVSLVTHLQV